MKFFYIAISIIVISIIPIISFILWNKKYSTNRPVYLGILGFFAFSAVLEWFFLYILLGVIPITAKYLASSIWGLVATSCICAGIFEEYGRYYIYKNCLDEIHGSGKTIGICGMDTPLGYASGHFGIEIVIWTVVPLIFSTPAVFGLSECVFTILERIAACLGHAALSTIVFDAYLRNKKTTLWLAIALHSICDAPLGLFKYRIIDLATAEIFFFIFVAILCVAAYRFRQSTKKELL